MIPGLTMHSDDDPMSIVQNHSLVARCHELEVQLTSAEVRNPNLP